MRFNLAAHVSRPSRKPIELRPIETTKAQADSLALLYLRVVRAWQEGTDRIVASYERTLGELTTDAPEDTAGIIDDLGEAIRRLVLTLTPDLREWAFRVEAVHRGKWLRNVLSATSIDLTTLLSVADVEQTVEAVVEWNTSLVRDVAEETRRRIANAVFSGFQQRTPAREVARSIREATGMARARSIRIAADQTVKLGSQLNEARQKQAGLDHFKWRHSGKRHPREHHQARDGKVYRWDDETIASDKPGAAPFCGCTAQGVVVFGE